MIGFFPGSFDPVTRGHLDLIRRALAFCPRLVIGIGENAKKKTLFTPDERKALLIGALDDTFDAALRARIDVVSYTGPTVTHAQTIGASIIVKGLRTMADYTAEETMVMVNRRLDDTIDTVFLFCDTALRDVSSSIAKEMALAGIAADKFNHYLTPAVTATLMKRITTE